MITQRQLTKACPALVLMALALPSSAFGQTTRTWVSGVGNDANVCSRTAPCKTFGGAIAKTAAGGEINALDGGGFGPVTITKSVTIKAEGVTGGVQTSGTNAIVINAAATDKVTLKGLDINGFGTGAPASLIGVKVQSAKSVHVVNSEIAKYKAAVAVVPTSAVTRVFVAHSHIHDNGVGVFNGPGSGAVTATSLTLRDNDIVDNTCGVATSSFGVNNANAPDASTNCGAAGSGSGINKTTVTSIYHNGIHDNGFGVFVRGSQAVAEIAYDEITGNSSFGLRRIDSGVIRTTSPATNVISNNAGSDAPNATTTLTRKAAKKARKARAKKRKARRV